MPGRFRFRGNAIGAAGQISIPFQEIIEVQAASALPEIGGYSKAKSAHFRYREILHFDSAHTEVVGSRLPPEDDMPVFATLVKSTVEGLNIMGMVTADRTVANLVSTYRGEDPGEPEVRLIGSRFENLKIAGIPVTVVLNTDTLDSHDTYKGLRDAYKGGDKYVRGLFGDDSLRQRFPKAPAEIVQWFVHGMKPYDDLPEIEGVSSVSLVRALKPEGSSPEYAEYWDSMCWGHVIRIEGFGTIRLGEVAISRLSRAVTMVQVELGCPVTGRVMCCSSEDGGSPW
jgi:hypothetical protein